ALQTFTLTVNEPADFTSASAASFLVGVSGSFTVTAGGVPAPTLAEDSNDPSIAGIAFNPVNGLLSGTAAAYTAGTYSLHFTAHNGASGDARQVFTLTVIQPP